MDGVDGSDHFAQETKEPPPSLLNIVIDTNPRAWALLKDVLPLEKAIANLQVFINAHLAFNHTNQVTVIASHVQHAEFLYPTAGAASAQKGGGEDVEMADATDANGAASEGSRGGRDDANFYRPFAQVKATIDRSLESLIARTKKSTVAGSYSTALAGGLTLALTYTNKLATGLSMAPTGLVSSIIPTTDPSGASAAAAALNARILVVSTSSANASQYIPLMNTVFAAQRLRIPIDVLSIPIPTSSLTEKAATATTTSSTGSGGISGDVFDPSSSFLQQAADATSGVFLPLSHPHGVLQTLFLAYLPGGPSREMLLMPTVQGVDFRAACFCHQRTVDVGYVCSVCLSIFCEPPPPPPPSADAAGGGAGGSASACLTCSTPLRLGGDGWARPPAVLPKRKKKKKRREDGGGGGTPAG